MKLICCTKCSDIYPIKMTKRTCKCKATGGHYLKDGWHAVYWGKKAVPLGFANDSFIRALKNRAYVAVDFRAFVIEKNCKTFAEVENAKSKVPDSIKDHILFCKESGIL